MSKTILIAGYTKMANIDEIRNYFPNEEVSILCAYTREPSTETKQKYITLFDEIYNLNDTKDIDRLKKKAGDINAITCTQERDMVAYIQSQLICGKITDKQAENYENLIDKRFFKEETSKKYPELVPEVSIIDDELLENLNSLTYPQVIKPTGLCGSIMVRVVNSPEEFRAHYDEFSHKMQEIAKEHYSKEIEIVTEEFIDGPQYSVNVYITANGDVVFCPIVRVVTPQEMGVSDTYSAFQYTTDELADTELEDLRTSVKKVVNHFELKSTSAHFDFVLQDNQWKLFEVGLRIGGNRQNLFELGYKMNHLHNDIMNRLGENIEIPEQKKSVCVMQKASEKHGHLQSISYTRSASKEKPALIKEEKMAKIGMDVMPVSLGGATLTRHIVSGKDHDDVMETSKQLFQDIKFDIS